jgi:Fe-Mn family superoxide dismutase
MTRRELLTGLAVASSLSALNMELAAQSVQRQLKPLPFDPGRLNGLSERLLRSHHENNYAGALRRLGQIEAQIAALPPDAPGFQIKGLKMEELIATNSVILHEDYFGNLGGNGKASGALQQAIVRDFGGFDKWEREFRAISNALGGGSGWAILSMNFRDGQLRNYIAFDHTDNIAFGRHILVNDMFEHAYHMDFGSAAARYVDAFMLNVHWEECERRYEEALKVSALIRQAP